MCESSRPHGEVRPKYISHTPYFALVPERPQETLFSRGMLEDVLSNPVTFVQWVRRGIPGDWLASLVGETGLEHEIAIALGMTSSQLRAACQADALDARTSENVLDLARLLSYCVSVWESHDQAVEWLSHPVHALADQIPMSLLDTFEGRRWLTEVLYKIEQGDFS
ncbi:antitoxin Xre/MbcA/ParS toxin-binding domain-containing protein [Marinobacter adhaerens]|mgnify:CR=1 FL=1|uniref:antitoxin Xre/MbcA/ParS toxin-binding domain-containing protein n=2 Tax=Marinobacter TaxID=2742 RepID=UPI001C5FA48B|nr:MULTISPECIES: antitoxin Xre/MbcA/ParS toxin-binding domain-containing protein [Marinobacter]MBW4979712.1 MbcA/ParS/Xre antitoxin family protein [Marinobacter adhaerens]MBY6073132.1 MbcA/ParS/Xre antitoxin family protein [Marinobacter salsuginis]